VDESLLVKETLTAVVQVDGKLRDKFEVSTSISEDQLRELALSSAAVARAMDGKEAKNIIVRAPKLVNISTK
jgi:leucyl-tRNA synthetase